MGYITMFQATRYFPGRCLDRHISVPTICRWMHKGVRGVLLRSKRVGGQRFTTAAWCQEFLEQLNATPPLSPQHWQASSNMYGFCPPTSDIIDGECQVIEILSAEDNSALADRLPLTTCATALPPGAA